MAHRLVRAGFDVVHCTDGEEVFQRISDPNLTLLILDAKLPGVDGFALLEELRQRASLAELPIMILSAHKTDADIVRAFELGADDYVAKPFSPAELLARIDRLLRRR